MQKLAGQAETDVMLSVQLLPGIISRDGSASNINVRGGTPDQNLILWDGIPVFNTGHIFGMISAFNPHAVDEIQVHSSGFKAEYGGRVSSVIEMNILEENPKPEIDLYTDLTHFSANAQWADKNNNIGGILSARKSWTDVFPSITFSRYSEKIFQLTRVDNQSEISQFPDIGVQDNLMFNDLQGKVFVKPFPNVEISASGFSNENEYEYEVINYQDESNRKDNLDFNNLGGKLNLLYHRPAWRTSLSYSSSSYDYSSRVTEDFADDPIIERSNTKANTLLQNNLKWKSQFNIDSTTELILGVDFEYIKTAFELAAVGLRIEDEIDIITREGNFTHIFADYHLNRNKFNLTLGTRLSLTNEYQQASYFEPRAAMTYHLTPKLSFRSGVGKYYQFLNQLLLLTISDLNDSQGIWVLASDSDLTSDNQINILDNVQWNIGAKWVSDDFLIDLEYYRKKVNGVSTHSTTTYFLPEVNLSNGITSIEGLDFLIRYRYKNLQTWVSYSYNNAFHTFEQLDVPSFPTNEWVKHRFTFLVAVTEGRMSFSGAFTVRSGLPYSEPNGFFIGNDNRTSIPIIRQFNNAILPSFKQFDVTIDYSIYVKNQKKGSVGIALNNLLDHENVFLRGVYEFFIPQFEGYRSVNVEKYYLRFTPNVFASWTF